MLTINLARKLCGPGGTLTLTLLLITRNNEKPG